MCLINFNLNDHPNYKLIVAANRDEAYGRPTAPAHFWEPEDADILAGRDLSQMGTWLGITKQGRFAALTNYRKPDEDATGKQSRGQIIRDYLSSDVYSKNFLESLKKNKNNYVGFNIIIGDQNQLFYYNNIENQIEEISPGTHSLSNHFLDTPWPKVTKGRTRLDNYVKNHDFIQSNDLFEILRDSEQADDHQLSDTGIGIELERKLSPLFIKTPNYGTRSSTVLLIDKEDQVTFIERTYKKGEYETEKHFSFQL